jgi:chemotaxis signal transduction protein
VAAHPFLLFYVGDSCFGIDAERVAEVIADAEIVRVPGVDASVAGVTFVRGRVFAVIDTAQLLGIPQPPEQDRRVLLVSAAGLEAGLLVTRTGDLALVALDELDPVPEGAAPGGIEAARKLALGVVSRMTDEELAGTTLLDAESLLGVAKERACAS